MSDRQLPEHLAYIVDAVRYGKSIRHQADKLQHILEAAWGCVEHGPHTAFREGGELTHYYRKLREAMAADGPQDTEDDWTAADEEQAWEDRNRE